MKLTGIGASKGVAMGRIQHLNKADISVYPGAGMGIREEEAALDTAVLKAKKELLALYEKALANDANAAEVFSVHQMMLEDPEYLQTIRDIILEGQNAAYAVSKARDSLKAIFDVMEDAYMQARGADVTDVSNRLIRILKGVSETEFGKEPCILAAEDLYPSDTLKLDKNMILGFVTRFGSDTSHSVILSRALGIPCIVGLGDSYWKLPKDGELLLMDGDSGELIIDATPSEREEFARRDAAIQKAEESLKEYCRREAVTTSGHRVLVCANIGNPADAQKAVEVGADGVGLFRSEFIYLNRNSFPTEDEQFEAYKAVLEQLNPRPVVIRTLDLGSDKQAAYFNIPDEDNPALGYRAIRISLRKTELFRTQLRALYRAGAFGNLYIMFPMISHMEQLLQAKKLAAEVKESLLSEGAAIADKVPLGMMVETPAAAILADMFAKEVEFFSIGTNDLTQYVLAADRLNPNVHELFDSAHPAVLKCIEMTANAAHAHGIWVGICGESAANTDLMDFYMRVGIDELSVSSSLVAEVRRAIILT